MTDFDALARQKCVPCKGGVPPMPQGDVEALIAQLGHAWQAMEAHHLEETFRFDDWTSAMAFANAISAIAEAQNHHPDLLVQWGEVTVTIFTHKIDGLTLSDFVLAAKVQEAAANR